MNRRGTVGTLNRIGLGLAVAGVIVLASGCSISPDVVGILQLLMRGLGT